jgi:hypothetical protein
MQLYYHTPLGSAILKLFDKIKQSIKSQYPTLPAGYVKAYIFGGAAVHIYTNARTSHDVDTDWNASLKLDTDLTIFYDEEDGNPKRSLVLDTNFNVNMGLIHPDYQEDAIVLQPKLDSPLWVDKLKGIALRRGAYLIDFFNSFYPVEENRRKQVKKQLDTLQQQLPPLPAVSKVPFYPDDIPAPGYDEIADFWGLTNGMRPARVPGLLDLQRRVNL